MTCVAAGGHLKDLCCSESAEETCRARDLPCGFWSAVAAITSWSGAEILCLYKGIPTVIRD